MSDDLNLAEIDSLADLSKEEALTLIGKTIARVNAEEYAIVLTFTDGSAVKFTGNRWDGCSLGVEIIYG